MSETGKSAPRRGEGAEEGKGAGGARPRRSRPRGDSRAGPLERAILAEAERLRRENFGALSPPEGVSFDLKGRLSFGEGGLLEAQPSLAEQLREALSEAFAASAVFRPGRVYCYRCESSGCGHSIPPRATEVFAGYSATGQPGWVEFSQLLLTRRHPRVERLFEEKSPPAALFIPAGDLTHRQLAVFGAGSKTYDLLGEVVFGYLRLRSARGAAAERAAITLQGVEVREGRRRPRVVLNVVGRLSDGTPAYEALEGPLGGRVLSILSKARRLLGGVGLRGGKRAPAERPSQAEAVLRKLAAGLDRVGRQRESRTAHAEVRRVDRRPTYKAREDALGAPPERFLWDQRHKTVVVVGPRQRVHVFSPEGRHVTTLQAGREQVESRRRRDRWRPLSPQEHEKFRGRLEGGEGGDG